VRYEVILVEDRLTSALWRRVIVCDTSVKGYSNRLYHCLYPVGFNFSITAEFWNDQKEELQISQLDPELLEVIRNAKP
jgi:hypothetical protein